MMVTNISFNFQSSLLLVYHNFLIVFWLFHNFQVGVAEMKVAVEKTGGLVVLAESFGHSVFKDSFKRVFEDGEQSLGLCFKWVLL